MARSSWLRSLTRRDKQGAPRQPARRRRAAPLALEQLEDRAVPAVVFQPIQGAETVSWKAGGNPPGQQGNTLDAFGNPILNGPLSSNPTALSNPAVYLIFLGPDWVKNGTPVPAVNRMVSEAQTILGSTYFSGLRDYGGPGTAHFVNFAVDDDSANHFLTTVTGGNPMMAETDYILSQPRYASWSPPGPTALTSPIYCVVRDNGGNAGSHGFGPSQVSPGDPYSPLPIICADIALSSTSQFDQFGRVFTHEVAESIFSGVLKAVPGTGGQGGLGVISPTAPNGYGECCDAEPDTNYYYRVQGVRVAPYWSVTAQATPGVAGAYLVPDGTTETVSLTPVWTNNNTSFSGQYDLTIRGDQFGANYPDQIVIDGTSSGTVVTLNGERYSFDAGQIRNVSVYPGGGANTVNVQEVAANQTVTIDSTGGTVAATVGKNGSLAGLLGNLSVIGGGARASLTLDDSRDGTRRVVTQDQGAVLGFYTISATNLGTVLYAGDALSALNIDGGTAADTFDFRQTAPNPTTTLDTGYGSDNIRVQATSGRLVITSTAANPSPGQARDSVLLGSRAPSLNGSLQGLFGPVSVSNAAGSTRLTVDDSADPNALNYTVTGSSLTNDYYLGVPAAINYGVGVSSLEIHAGQGANTFHVLATGPATTIDAGSGTAAVTVGDAGHNLLFVGDLTVNGNGATALTVDDRGNGPAPTGFPGYTPLLTQYLVQSGSLTRTALAAVVLPEVGPTELGFTSVIKYGRLGGVTIDGGPLGPYTYQIDSTAGAAGVTVNAGSSLDVVTAGDAQNNLKNVAALSVNGNGHTTLTLDDRGNTVVSSVTSSYVPLLTQYVVLDQRLTRLALALVQPSPLPQPQLFAMNVAYQGLAGLTVYGGPTGPYTYQIDGTVGADSVTVNAGGQDVVTVGDAGHNLKDVASLTVNGNGSTILVVDDRGNLPAVTASSVYVPLLTQFFVQSGISQQPPSGTLTRVATALASPAPGFPPTMLAFGSTITYQGLTGLTIDGGHAVRGIYEIDSTNGTQALTLNGGNVFNVFNVEGTTAGTTTTVNGGSGGSSINLSPTAHNLANLAGLVSINGQGGTNTLNVHDDGTTNSQNYSIYADSIHRFDATDAPDMAAIAYTGIGHLAFYQGKAQAVSNFGAIRNVLVVWSSAQGTTADIYGGPGENFNDVRPYDADPGTAADNRGILGDVHFHGNNLFDSLSYYDYLDPAGQQTYTLSVTATGGQIVDGGFATVTYDSKVVAAGIITSRQGGNTVNVLSTAAFAADGTQIQASTGDHVIVGMPVTGGRTLAGINGPLSIFSVDGNPNVVPAGVVLDDSGDTTPHPAVVINGPAARPGPDVVGLAPAYISWLSLAPATPVTILGGSGGNTFNVESTLAGTTTTINGGTGGSTFNLSPTAHNLANLAGLVSITGQGGTNTLNVFDQATTFAPGGGDDDELFQDHFTRPDSPVRTVFTYGGVQSVNVSAGRGDSGFEIFGIVSTPAGVPVTVTDASPTSQVEFFAGSPLDFIQGPLTFHGRAGSLDEALVNDAVTASPQTYTVTANAVTRTDVNGNPDMAPITFDNLPAGVVFYTSETGAHATVNVQSVAAATPFGVLLLTAGDQVTVNAPGVQGALRIQSIGAVTVPVSVTVDDSSDSTPRTATFSPDPNYRYLLNGLAPGRIYLDVDPGSSVQVLGGSGGNTFNVQSPPPAGVNLAIDGGAGVNTLDYSAWVGDVTVNLQLGTATGLGGGIRNIANVTGSVGNDLLVGDANANVLIGGTGRNVIIGGGGADRITGGGGDNLLIGGTTDYDLNAAALELIRQEWLLASDFATRVAALQTGGDLLSGSGIHLDSTTVHPDGLASVTPGPGNNWVIA